MYKDKKREKRTSVRDKESGDIRVMMCGVGLYFAVVMIVVMIVMIGNVLVMRYDYFA